MVDVEFLINIGGDLTGLQGQAVTPYCTPEFWRFSAEFPRKPTNFMKQYITDEANARLAFYSPLPSTQPPIVPVPPRPQLPEGVIDAPLVRLYNFLRMIFFWMTPYFINNNFIYRDDVLVVSVGNFMVSGWESTRYRNHSLIWVIGWTDAVIRVGKIFIRGNVERQEDFEGNLLAVRRTHNYGFRQLTSHLVVLQYNLYQGVNGPKSRLSGAHWQLRLWKIIRRIPKVPNEHLSREC
jgi:hypothetical protein